jgi:hypothetical protein
MIRKRAMLREARFRFIVAPTDGLVDGRSAENLDCAGPIVEVIGYLLLFQLV